MRFRQNSCWHPWNLTKYIVVSQEFCYVVPIGTETGQEGADFSGWRRTLCKCILITSDLPTVPEFEKVGEREKIKKTRV